MKLGLVVPEATCCLSSIYSKGFIDYDDSVVEVVGSITQGIRGFHRNRLRRPVIILDAFVIYGALEETKNATTRFV